MFRSSAAICQIAAISKEGWLFTGSDVGPDCVFPGGFPWTPRRTTHSAAGERKRFFLKPTAEHFPTKDDVERKANERRGGFRWHWV